MSRLILALVLALLTLPIGHAVEAANAALKIGTFDVDASPPIGNPMAYDPTKGVRGPLHCEGVVFLGEGAPIVLVTVDWIGIGGGGQDAFKSVIATAVGTSTDRVTVHTLHQHDAPTCDFGVATMLSEHGIDPSATEGVIDGSEECDARCDDGDEELGE